MGPRVVLRSLVSVALAALAALGGLGALAPACEGQRSYVYTAQKYEPDQGCLEAYAPIEVVPGEGTNATCAPACLTVGTALYVSTVCPPLPANAQAVADDAAACLAAIDAANNEAGCGAGGDGGDDGGDAEAGGDDGGDAEAGSDDAEAGGDADAGGADAAEGG